MIKGIKIKFLNVFFIIPNLTMSNKHMKVGETLVAAWQIFKKRVPLTG
jgi:hypothetical protein